MHEYRSEHREIIPGADGEYEIDITVRFSALGADYIVGEGGLELLEWTHVLTGGSPRSATAQCPGAGEPAGLWSDTWL